MQGHKTGQLGTHRHLAAFTAFSVLDDNGALGQAHVFNTQGHELRHAGAGFQEHLHHQSDLAALCISLVNEAQFLLQAQASRRAAVFLRGLQPCLGARLLEDRLGLGIVEALAHEDIGDLA